MKKALKKGLIFVDEKAGKTSTFIYGGERIELRPSVEDNPSRVFDKKLEVVYEDDYLAVINKPAGILVSGNKLKTIANALVHNLKKSNEGIRVAPQPVHRLDYPTTGLLLIGKTSTSIITLNRLFEKKLITKTYHAVTMGNMKSKGRIVLAIDDKPSITEFVVLQSVVSERFGYLNLVKLNPKTGRRHQLRKHLASVGNPILGDKNYGSPDLILKGKGLYLHASSLEFIHPFTNEIMTVQKEVPKKFERLFDLSKDKAS